MKVKGDMFEVGRIGMRVLGARMIKIYYSMKFSNKWKYYLKEKKKKLGTTEKAEQLKALLVLEQGLN